MGRGLEELTHPHPSAPLPCNRAATSAPCVVLALFLAVVAGLAEGLQVAPIQAAVGPFLDWYLVIGRVGRDDTAPGFV